MAELVVRLINGRDLIAVDSNGKSDPYVVIEATGKTKSSIKSKVVKGNLNPDYNQTFVMRVKKGDQLVFRVFDSDLFSKDDPMGTGTLSLEGVEEGKESVRTVRLEDVPSGTVTVGLMLRKRTKDASDDEDDF